MHFSIKDLVENTNGELLLGDLSTKSEFTISTDTRKLEKDSFYLPLRGENYDGHSFIDSAVQKGVKGYFTQDKTKINKSANFVIYVENTLVAYLKLAQTIRNKINPKVIAITGSSGKTTVKEMLYSVLSTEFKTHKTALNHNNEIGLCQTMFAMPLDTEYLILELGMRNLGEIELLGSYATPDVGIITNVGTAHVELLGSVKNIAVAKCEIASHLKRNGVFIAPSKDIIRDTVKFEGEKLFVSPNLADEIAISKGKTTFKYKNELFELSVSGEHNVENALLVIEAGEKAGIRIENIKKGLKNFKPIEKRWEASEIKGFNFINDSYNANPESMKAAIKTFLTVTNPPVALVLGDMGELGRDSIKYHKQIGEFISSYKNNKDIEILTVGEKAKFILKASLFEGKSFDTTDECANYMAENLKKGTTILLKASRFMKFENIIDRIKNL